MKKTLDKLTKFVAIALIASFAFIGCSSDDDSENTPSDTQQEETKEEQKQDEQKSSSNPITLASTLWDEKNSPLTIAPDADGNTFIGWKDYGNKLSDGSALDVSKRSSKAGTITEATYTAEYSSNALILDRTVSKSGEYADATTSKWNNISSWTFEDLKTEFGITE